MMGEMADYVNETMDGWYSRSPETNITTVCKYCGKRCLTWKNIDGKWKLHERSGIIHKCNKYEKDPEKNITEVERKLLDLSKEIFEEGKSIQRREDTYDLNSINDAWDHKKYIFLEKIKKILKQRE